jgi:thymidylate synthase ThyX
MSYEVSILADSIHPNGSARLTTFEVTFPRFILAEVNTHRILSRNSGSSRAIPTERFIEAISNNPFIPEFNERVKGMGVGATFSPEDQEKAETYWLQARDACLASAGALMHLGVDKSRANRLLEPFMWHTAIISATHWDNFFALRTTEGAQPEFRIIAKLMQEALAANEPRGIDLYEWHLPLIEPEDYLKYANPGWENSEQRAHGFYSGDWDTLKKIAVGRLARRSSYNRTDPEPDERSIERCDILSSSGHWSPFEHVASPIYNGQDSIDEFDPDCWSGNFFGFFQYRKEFLHEDDYSKVEQYA